MRRAAPVLAFLASAPLALAQTFNLQSDWSETANPNGPWSLLEGANLLPHVDWWHRNLGGWTQPQPAWARSEDGATRLPAFLRSNGSESFPRDWIQGDILCHSWDSTNGVGAGHPSVRWTASQQGSVRILGAVWLGRDIGRAVNWEIFLNNARLTGGSLFDGDPYSRQNPFFFNTGDAGPSAVKGILVAPNDSLSLRLLTVTLAGDFVGIDLTLDFRPIPCLADANGDNNLNFTDLNIVLSNFGLSGPNLPGDLNHDDNVNFTDLNIVLSNFGLSCPTPA